MTSFRFEGTDAAGRIRKGSIDAPDAASAAAALRRQGLLPHAIREDRTTSAYGGLIASRGVPVSLAWRLAVIRKLTALLTAGIPLDRALQLLVAQDQPAQQQAVLNRILASVAAGQSLSAAVARSGAGFAPDEVGLIGAGEQAGELPRTLLDLTAILERRVKLRNQLASALIYPAFLLTLIPVSLLVIAFVLVPNIAPLFEDNDAAMPLTLRAMVAVTAMLRDEPLTTSVLAAVVVVAALLWLPRLNWGALLAEAANRVPILSHIARDTEASRICGVLASLLRGGASIQAAMGHCAAAAVTGQTREAILAARDAVQGGAKLARALENVRIIDSSSLQMIAVGEETNALVQMLSHVASSKESEAERLTGRLIALLTPLLTIMMGVFVGGIVMSIMQAILKVNELAVQ